MTLLKYILRNEESLAANTGIAKVAVHSYADTFVVKIASFTKPKKISRNYGQTINSKQKR
jgi:hypothetical protein